MNLQINKDIINILCWYHYIKFKIKFIENLLRNEKNFFETNFENKSSCLKYIRPKITLYIINAIENISAKF